MGESKFTKGEERANFISHLVGALLALIGLVILIIFSSVVEKGLHIVAASIFGVSMFLVYLFSTIFHGLSHRKAKGIFLILDQIGIFLMIAGTYTPITLILLKGTLGWVLFGVEWGLAIAGILITAFSKVDPLRRVHPIKITSYVIMGLLILIAIHPLFNDLPRMGLTLLFAGGGFYLIGLLFFSMRNVKYSHLVWHLFVLFGTICHYLLIFMFILPINV